MAEDGTRKSERLKEVFVRFINDKDVHNLIQPLSYFIKEKRQQRANKSDVTSDIYAKNFHQKKSRLSGLDKQIAKSPKDANSSYEHKKHSYLEEDSRSEANGKEEDSDIKYFANYEKPTTLFEEDDISGKQMFGFQTPKRKGAMALKASESASKTTPTEKVKVLETVTSKQKKTVSTSKTPLSTRSKTKENTAVVTSSKTPYSLRTKLKRRISAEKLREVVDSESDCSDSDFNIDSDSESELDDKKSLQESSNSSSEDEDVQTVMPRRSLFNQSVPVSTTKRKKKDLSYVFTSDAYFESRANKIKTSDHTLNRLRTPRLTQDKMNSLLKNISHSHELVVRKLINEHMTRFNSWRFSLSQGFNILVYGLGSKRSLLNNFHKEMLRNSLVLVVNGFFPSLTIKEMSTAYVYVMLLSGSKVNYYFIKNISLLFNHIYISKTREFVELHKVVDSIAGDLLGLKNIPPQPLAAVAWIESKLSCSSKRVFLILHNLDGVMLRNEKTQTILSRLASIPQVHLIASVDHINCPLLWDHNKLSNFNFVWEDATSFLPYNEETSFETSLMVQRSGSLALASLTNVFQSLTKNAREIFKLLLEDHLSNKSNQKYIGIALSDLYRQSRDAMLVTSDLALRTQLTEFLDHQLVKWRRDSDHLYIPIDSTILKQFQKSLQENEL